MNSKASTSLFATIDQNSRVLLSIDKLSKGIDNYHIDVKLSSKFSSDIKKLVALLVSQIAIPKPKHWDNSNAFEKIRTEYLDMMTILIHRVKTDLSADEICFLQFAAIKIILRVTKAKLDSDIGNVTSRLADHRNKGSSEALATDQRLFWLKKNYDSILYNVNKQIFGQLQRVEERQLASIRKQFLGEEYKYIVDVLFNPILLVSDPSALPLMINEFCVYSWNGEATGFIDLNAKIEKLLNKRLRLLPLPAIGEDSTATIAEAEIHDELGGLFQTQTFFGPAKDTKALITEELSWLESPEIISALFDSKKNREQLATVRGEHGFGAWWKRRGETRNLERTLAKFFKLLRSEKILAQLLSSHHMRRSLNPLIMEQIDLKTACQFLSGNITTSKLQDSISGGNKLSSEQVKSLESLKAKIKDQISNADAADSLKLLIDVSRYRRALKYFRFAHRVFNRFTLLSSEQDLKLSKSAGTLYLMPTSTEIEEDDERICHHAIMKADVRGSTTVTDELQNKGLNPASYFSMRFFNPINKILETYGATKVFIEGDAIILSFLEFEHTPQEWFSVARACGYSKDMLKIVGSNNRYSTQMGLPLLELGVGICYADVAPRYLYDEDRSIMISGAIGDADRMSGCSWILREAIQKSLFNIDVLRMADGEFGKGEKGQQYIRYNVNGILLDDAAFSKLRDEITLRSVRMKLNGKQYLFHVGQYPDTSGRKKDLIIRVGKVGIWKGSQVHEDPDTDEVYYEVVVNRKVTKLVLETVSEKETATA
ncbi:MAG: hypothetical protein COB20_08515 [SAR86 cluster bacterium]|uniref:Guanylate cyclase domain-containing protein n=1 Tax=SAR86 cluster bacterium TaxID=2030880 RepID=A0A2A4X3R4_9GAMM|nr:MAG: hypothetical protein COB20_08515 [SAR86 cluster bacterium]